MKYNFFLANTVHVIIYWTFHSFIIWYYNFLLIEGLEFFNRNCTKDESYDFAKHRRELKQIVRSKVKNNMCNHRPRRKKLGGHKAQKFRKHTISCSYWNGKLNNLFLFNSLTFFFIVSQSDFNMYSATLIKCMTNTPR